MHPWYSYYCSFLCLIANTSVLYMYCMYSCSWLVLYSLSSRWSIIFVSLPYMYRKLRHGDMYLHVASTLNSFSFQSYSTFMRYQTSKLWSTVSLVPFIAQVVQCVCICITFVAHALVWCCNGHVCRLHNILRLVCLLPKIAGYSHL